LEKKELHHKAFGVQIEMEMEADLEKIYDQFQGLHTVVRFSSKVVVYVGD
jgi:hypothetical protein